MLQQYYILFWFSFSLLSVFGWTLDPRIKPDYIFIITNNTRLYLTFKVKFLQEWSKKAFIIVQVDGSSTHNFHLSSIHDQSVHLFCFSYSLTEYSRLLGWSFFTASLSPWKWFSEAIKLERPGCWCYGCPLSRVLRALLFLVFSVFCFLLSFWIFLFSFQASLFLPKCYSWTVYEASGSFFAKLSPSSSFGWT